MNYEELQPLLTQAEELSNKGNYDQAEKLANEIVRATRELPQPDAQATQLRANATRLLGAVAWRRGYYPKALEHYNSALLLSQETADKAGIAKALGNIGNVHGNLSDYPKALEYYGKALTIDEELGNKRGVAIWLGNIGILYGYLSDYPKALEFFRKALSIDEKIGNRQQVGNHLGNIGHVYLDIADYPKALEYLGEALMIVEELGSKVGVANHLGNIGNVHSHLSDYPKALEYYGKALSIDEQLGNKAGVAMWLGNMGTVHRDLADYHKALEYFGKALSIYEEIGSKLDVARQVAHIGELYSDEDFNGFDVAKAEELMLKALVVFTEIGANSFLVALHHILSELYKHEGRWEEAFEHFKKHIAIKDEINIEETKKQEAIRQQQKEIEIERTRATAEKNILNNILPEEITQRLIKGENPIADHFDCVSVLFMDIVDFTPLSSSITAQQLVHLLNAIFTAADGVMREFGMEKIKTIGDAYMAVAGAPVVQTDHAHRAAQAALKLLEVMENLVVRFPDSYGDRSWIESIPEIKVRIGLHCGPVAAGVVGENKFLYDLWGDAVNTAARMESHGEAGRIHISDDFRIAVETCRGTSLHTIEFIERGEMEIKGKGTMRTYFLERL